MTVHASIGDTGSTVTQPQTSAAVHHYVISGLTVASTIKLPSAIPAPAAEPADVTIVEGPIPDRIANCNDFGDFFQIAGDRVRMQFPGTMSVLVETGSRITLQREATAVDGDVVLYLLGTTFAIALQQRGRVVLHASAVAVGDKAMLFCGESGAGKSTMVAMLSRRGHAVLNDDVCNLSRRADGLYEVHPDGRMLKLWSQTMDHLQASQNESQRIRSDAAKFYVAPEAVDLTPRVVGGVYILHVPDEAADASLTKLSAAEAIQELTLNAYRPGLVHAMKLQADFFKASASIAANGGVYRLSRVKDFSRADEPLHLLEQSWNAAAQHTQAEMEQDV